MWLSFVARGKYKAVFCYFALSYPILRLTVRFYPFTLHWHMICLVTALRLVTRYHLPIVTVVCVPVRRITVALQK